MHSIDTYRSSISQVIHDTLRLRKTKVSAKSINSFIGLNPKDKKEIHEIRRKLADEVYVLVNKNPV